MTPSLRLALALGLAVAPGPRSDDDGEPPARLAMTPAVACKSVAGFEDYVELPEAEVTAEEKLLVYYVPRSYAIRREADGKYLAHFEQDARVRRRGSKTAIWSKAKILDYKARSPEPPERVYLTNVIGLRGLKPGEYDLEIILRDKLTEGSQATQVVKFRVVPVKASTKGDAGDAGKGS